MRTKEKKFLCVFFFITLSTFTQKLAGQCGKLKCCLNYELGSYMDALRNFPKKEIKKK